MRGRRKKSRDAQIGDFSRAGDVRSCRPRSVAHRLPQGIRCFSPLAAEAKASPPHTAYRRTPTAQRAQPHLTASPRLAQPPRFPQGSHPQGEVPDVESGRIPRSTLKEHQEAAYRLAFGVQIPGDKRTSPSKHQTLHQVPRSTLKELRIAPAATGKRRVGRPPTRAVDHRAASRIVDSDCNSTIVKIICNSNSKCNNIICLRKD